ncbi:AraC family transcriptional regulator [Neobacillus bataviensis LMG 21833]|uniref:AraC family transcriptional regulator n=1 Tax=Neobacillus bataviensis LMG 21833 TaxID=1117379 RepID=K6DA74_9BACI|nr:helix-turn-helix domain-containing protein [Neobacillus bataviensis]EKN65219.1 AraC family transcriptional regulator [Neobacillus bataviensis LMG 21833]
MFKVPSKLQLKYVLSYMLIFLVPFSTMAFIFYQNSVSSLRGEIELSNINNLNNIKTITDSRLKELAKTAQLISFNPKLSSYMIKKSEFQSEAIKQLEKYKENSSIITDINLFFQNQNMIYSSKGLMSSDIFLRNQTGVPNISLSQELLTNEIMKIDSPHVSTNVKLFSHHPVFLYPLSSGSGNPYGSLVFELDETFFQEMIRNTLGSFEGNVFILNQNHEVIVTYSNNKDSSLKSADILKITNNKSGISEIKINNVNYSISTVKSETSSWSFATVIPTKQFFSKVSKFKTFIFLVIAFIVFVTSIISIYISLRQYHPIKNLIEFVKGKDTAYQLTSKNEFDSLQKSIENMYTNHENLHERFAKQEPLLRDQCLMMLLQGQMKAAEHARDLFESFQLHFENPYSFVMVASCPTSQLSDLSGLSQILSDINVYEVELINDNVMAYIANCETDQLVAKQQFLERFEKWLLEHEATAIIGVGETYKGKEQINRSFIEASAAHERGKGNKKCGITSFIEIKESHESLWLPNEHLLKLSHSYKQGNAKIAKESITCLFTWLKQNHSSILLSKHMKYDIMNTIMKTITDMNLSYYLEKFYYLTEIDSLEQLEEKLALFTDDICQVINRNKETQKNELQSNIFKYIADHFDQYDLSLEKLAGEFNLSTSYLSRFIKEETSITFSQYVWELRLNEVKNQLAQTKLPVKEIISEVGYIDVPNFTRKFKSAVGITPGEYRKLNSQV